MSYVLLETLPAMPVTVDFPVRDAVGALVVSSCVLMIAQYDDDQFAALVSGIQSDKLTDRDIASRVLVDWADVVDASGAQVSLTGAARALFLSRPGVSASIVRKFFALRRELDAGLTGNSSGSANTSPGAQPA